MNPNARCRFASTAAVLLLLMVFTGCGKGGPQIAPVHGRVTLNGQPLENADITFQPEDSKSPSAARTDKDGHYELGYKRGVLGGLVGQHTVRIRVSSEVVENPPNIPERYNTATELHREVKAGPNEFNFDLTTAEK
jgi:hypothetical protein